MRTTMTLPALRKLAAVAAAALVLAACGGGGGSGEAAAPAAGDDPITLGFSQVGAESGWRTANTKSIQDSAAAAGIELKFSDAQQKQENQIKAIRSFIQQRVDVIAFSPVVESGWDTVLQEAKRANIPVILTDRAVDSPDTTLYKTFLGSDFVEEGKKAGEWLVEEYDGASRAGEHRRAAGHHRLGAGDRPQGGLRRGDQGQPELQDHRLADR